MKDPLRRAALLVGLVIATGVLVVGIVPDLLWSDAGQVAIVHAVAAVGAGAAGYLLILRLLKSRERAQYTAAVLESDRQTRERLLAENLQQRKLLETIFEAMVEGVIVFDAAGTPLRANPPAAALLGASLGRPDRDLMAREQQMRRVGGAPMSHEELPSFRALQGETVRADRVAVTDAQGRELTLQSSASPLWVDGKIAGAVTVWHDVTELERTEAQLREALQASQRREAEVAALAADLATSEERWRSLVESANDAMVTLDKGGNIVFWNRAAATMFGHDDQGIAGRPFASLLAVRNTECEPAGKDEGAWEELPAEAVAAGAASGRTLEGRGRRRNGEDFPLEYSFAAWETREGAFITATLRDITERVQARKRARQLAVLEERQHLSRELHDSVSQALYGIALGSRTALALIDKDRTGTVEALEYVVSLAQLALTEMRAVIFGLRPESLEREGLITGLVRHTAAMRARYPVAVQEDLHTEPDAALEVKEAVYWIAREALNNAVKHGQAKEIRLGLRECGNDLRLEIRDDGAGFDPSQAFPGHFGLQTMRERVVEKGGTLEIDSEPGRGTRVVATIPAQRSRG